MRRRGTGFPSSFGTTFVAPPTIRELPLDMLRGQTYPPAPEVLAEAITAYEAGQRRADLYLPQKMANPWKKDGERGVYRDWDSAIRSVQAAVSAQNPSGTTLRTIRLEQPRVPVSPMSEAAQVYNQLPMPLDQGPPSQRVPEGRGVPPPSPIPVAALDALSAHEAFAAARRMQQKRHLRADAVARIREHAAYLTNVSRGLGWNRR